MITHILRAPVTAIHAENTQLRAQLILVVGAAELLLLARSCGWDIRPYLDQLREALDWRPHRAAPPRAANTGDLPALRETAEGARKESHG
jgi:hypothetical protein